MNRLRRAPRFLFERLELALDRAFPPAWNPLYNLGALGFFFYWIIVVSGVYLYIFFDTGITRAYGSIESLTHEQWYLGGVMRSLHRYASDGLVLVMALHLLREFSLDRYRGVRWFSWVTGIVIIGFVLASGITGYWLVWDQLAQYVAITTTEWLDHLPLFGEPIARNFLSPRRLDARFFTLVMFMHIAIPLLLLLVLWIHLQRVSRPKINPPRGLAVGTFLMMLALSLVKPATSQGPADLATVPAVIGLDWFYLGFYPLLERWPGIASWGMAVSLTVILVALPWLPPLRRAPVAVVDLANCNGCTRCAADCPYDAIQMMPRSDGRAFEREAVVDPSACVSCGICAGACPTSMPFRRASALIPGIDLPSLTMAALRERLLAATADLGSGPRIVVLGCDHGVSLARVAGPDTAALSLACIGQLPPSYVDFILSRGLADGVLLTGCDEGACYNRFGIAWTEARLAGERDPHLRARVPRERLVTCWAGHGREKRLAGALAELRARLAAAGVDRIDPRAAATAARPRQQVAHG